MPFNYIDSSDYQGAMLENYWIRVLRGDLKQFRRKSKAFEVELGTTFEVPSSDGREEFERLVREK